MTPYPSCPGWHWAARGTGRHLAPTAFSTRARATRTAGQRQRPGDLITSTLPGFPDTDTPSGVPPEDQTAMGTDRPDIRGGLGGTNADPRAMSEEWATDLKSTGQVAYTELHRLVHHLWHRLGEVIQCIQVKAVQN